MRLRLTADVSQITEAINRFPARYSDDYFQVRPIGQKYVTESQPTETVALELANEVTRVLRSWGAGKREAPRLRDTEGIFLGFLDDQFHAELAKLSSLTITDLSIDHKSRRLIHSEPSAGEIQDFDRRLLSVLRGLSDLMFWNNTNVTYPMKALLLISGLMPALDNRVRTGLGKSGLKGIKGTQFLLPGGTSEAGAKKLTRLPFLLGQCWQDYSEQLQNGIRQSVFSALVREPGRVFDVLLFMQGEDERPPILVLDPERKCWYDLL